MSNNSEYTREYIDTVEEWFRTYDRVIHGPAMDKTLSYQKVLEFGAIHGEVEKFKEYLLNNTVLQDEIEALEEQHEEYKAVKKALLKLKVQLDTFYHCIQEDETGSKVTDREEYAKWVDMIDELAEGEVPEELKDKVKSQQKKSKK